MFKQSANQALIQKVSLSCLYIECDDRWISAVVLTENYAVTALHCIPDTFRQIGLSVVLCGAHGQNYNVHIHGLNKISDYVVFKKADGVFDSVPEMVYPMLLDRYIVMGFSFGEKKPSVSIGHISSFSTGSQGFFYGDSGGLPGFSGGGVFYARNGALMGIARGSDWDGKDTKQYGDVLEMISVQDYHKLKSSMQMEKNMSSDENLNDAQRNVGGPSQEAIPQLRKSKERSASQSQEGSLGERMGEETRRRRGRSRELPSADKLGKSDKRKKKHPLRNVPEYLIGNISVVIPWKGGHDFSLQVNSFMQIVQAPKNKELGDKLDLGDILVKFNDIEVPDKRLLRTVMEEFNKENLHKTETEVKLVLKRMKYMEALPINSPKIPPVIEIQGAIFNYFQGFMLLHPQSSVGMKIKTYNSKVYVTSTDNGFFCIAKRTLLVGDAILAVDDKPVANNRECGTMITNALGDRGFVSLIIERPADAQVAGPLVRAALMADKQQELDPRMADDVVEICRQEILNRQPDVLYKREHVKPILRVKRGRSKQKIGFKEKSTEFTIDMDPINPLLLRRVPPPAERGVPKGQNVLIPPAPSSSPIGSHHSGQLHHPQLINKGPKQVVLVKKGTWQQHL